MVGWDPQILTLKQLRDWFNTKLKGDIYWMLASRILSNSHGCLSCIFENGGWSTGILPYDTPYIKNSEVGEIRSIRDWRVMDKTPRTTGHAYNSLVHSGKIVMTI